MKRRTARSQANIRDGSQNAVCYFSSQSRKKRSCRDGARDLLAALALEPGVFGLAKAALLFGGWDGADG